MRRGSIILASLLSNTFLCICLTHVCSGQEKSTSVHNPKSVLIVYHGGEPPMSPVPSIEDMDVDALTQATSEDVNVKIVASGIRDRLITMGYRADLLKAIDVQGPKVFLDYDCIIFGTPTWFSDVAYPIKKVFDEHLIRIYQHRPGRLNDKILAGFTTAMSEETAQFCLQSLNRALEHFSKQVVKGIIINIRDNKVSIDTSIQKFCERISQALKE